MGAGFKVCAWAGFHSFARVLTPDPLRVAGLDLLRAQSRLLSLSSAWCTPPNQPAASAPSSDIGALNNSPTASSRSVEALLKQTQCSPSSRWFLPPPRVSDLSVRLTRHLRFCFFDPLSLRCMLFKVLSGSLMSPPLDDVLPHRTANHLCTSTSMLAAPLHLQDVFSFAASVGPNHRTRPEPLCFLILISPNLP